MRLCSCLWKMVQRDERGSVAIIFAMSLLVLMICAGMGIDYSRAQSFRTEMQNAVDAAALAMASNIGDVPDEDLQSAANDVFQGHFDGTATVTATKLERGVELRANGKLPMTLMHLAGIKEMDISTLARAERETRKIEVALVLDSSGSMAGMKMTQTKAAAEALITSLKNSESADDIVMSIVPFDAQVNVGKSNSSKSWIYWDQATLDAYGVSKETARQYWQGCVADRTQSYDVNDDPPGNENAGTSYWAAICDSSGSNPVAAPTLASIQPLTSDWSSLSSKVQSLDPNNASKTNLTIGLVWGLATLSDHKPFDDAEPFSAEVAKYLILLTDGENVKNRFTSVTAQIDKRTRLACAAVKEKGITVFTVRVIAGNASLLEECASDSAHYTSIADANELTDTFEDIGRNITRLRLTK